MRQLLQIIDRNRDKKPLLLENDYQTRHYSSITYTNN